MNSITRSLPWGWVTVPCIVLLAGCAQPGPNNADLQKQLQNQLPSYWEITSFEIKEKAQLGTKVEPVVTTRFKAVANLKEDIFVDAGKIDSIELDRQQGVTFIRVAEKSGKTVEIYGVATSRLVAESWQTNFRFDSNATVGAARPRSSWSGRTILKGSSEEEQFVAEVKKQIENERAFIIEALSSDRTFSGTFTRKDLDGTFSGIFSSKAVNKVENFKIRFSSFDKASGSFRGEMEFPEDYGLTIEIKGSFSGTQLTYEQTQPIISENRWRADSSVYTLRNVGLKKMQGTWELNPSVALLGNWSKDKRMYGDISINLE